MTVHFVGAGPGAPDLITVRGLKIIQRCQVCLYAGSLVPEEVVEAAPEGARVIDTAPMNLEEIIDEMAAAHEAGHDVARVHSGDPSIYGAVAGALVFVMLRPIAEDLGAKIPYINELSSAQQSTVLFTLLVVFFLVVEPLGLFGIWLRIKRYFAAWPFRY